MSPLPEDVSSILAHLARCYPEEGCGVVLHGPAGHRVVPVRNAAASRRAFSFDPSDWLALLTEADRRGEQVSCIFHSHPDQPAHLSAEDLRRTAPTGEPLLPGAALLVVSVHQGRPESALLYRRLRKTWVPEPVPIDL